MTRIAIRLAALVLCALAFTAVTTATAGAVSAKERPVYKLAVGLDAGEDREFQEEGFPRKCDSWTAADGKMGYDLLTRRSMVLTLVSLGRHGVWGEIRDSDELDA